jgi:hypothetical protein
MRGTLHLSSVFISCLVGIQQPSIGQSPCVERDPNRVRAVVSGVKACGGGTGLFEPFGRAINQLGDDVSVSVLKGLELTELTKPENVRGYLCMVRIAFYNISTILREEDRVPHVTIFLLEYLKEEMAHDGDLEAQINSVESYVKQQTQEQPRTKSN